MSSLYTSIYEIKNHLRATQRRAGRLAVSRGDTNRGITSPPSHHHYHDASREKWHEKWHRRNSSMTFSVNVFKVS